MSTMSRGKLWGGNRKSQKKKRRKGSQRTVKGRTVASPERKIK